MKKKILSDEIFCWLIFVFVEFTPYKAEESLRGMEIQEKVEEKN